MTSEGALAGGEEQLVARAVDGDQAALEEVVRLLRDPLYRLALRMVSRPAVSVVRSIKPAGKWGNSPMRATRTAMHALMHEPRA